MPQTQSEIKEKFYKKFANDLDPFITGHLQIQIANFWLAEINNLLTGIEGEAINLEKDLNKIIVKSFRTECVGYNKAVFDILEIIRKAKI